MKRLEIGVAIIICFFLVSPSYAGKKRNVIRVPGGTSVPELGLVIDASYDKRLDSLVPGYKVITVALVNESLNVIPLDPEKDAWSIKLAGDSRAYQVIHDLRSKDPKAWSEVPEKAKAWRRV